MAKNKDSDEAPVEELKDKTARRTLPELCAEYRRLAEEAAAIELAKSAVKQDIDVMAERTKLRKITGHGWMVLKVKGKTTRKLVPELLMENGVDADVIEKSTVESVGEPHFQVRKVKAAD